MCVEIGAFGVGTDAGISLPALSPVLALIAVCAAKPSARRQAIIGAGSAVEIAVPENASGSKQLASIECQPSSGRIPLFRMLQAGTKGDSYWPHY